MAVDRHADRVHVIGAGLAGLSAAVRLLERGHGPGVVVWEAAGHVGGRARSFFDETLGAVIDNGNHLMLSGNRATEDLVAAIGSGAQRRVFPGARFPFVDIASGARWAVDINAGRLPWWVFTPHRRPPGVGAFGLLADARRLMGAGTHQTVGDVLDKARPAFARFWEPLAVAVLNAPADDGSAYLLGNVLRETLGRGGRAMRPVLAREGLSALLGDPARAYIENRGGTVHLGARLKGIETAADRLTTLHVEQDAHSEAIALADGDAVVLALPPEGAGAVLPGMAVPVGHHAILNVHFRLPDDGAGAEPTLLGLIGGQADWVFRRGGVASVTVSAADPLMAEGAEDLATQIWGEIRGPLCLGMMALPPARVIKERRATFAATPANEARRASTQTPWANLFMAGDWTATNLPATIEGAVRSGFAAATAVLGQRA